ncbi:Metallo-dependent phosphatase [Leucogyrophana mollusca]|uniref:Metallo-dependent phosphatase n=1 Tax=Leucogyrophana mollusca TaxID=85980 RepID=A0ACB8AZZ2_9AGAM|nr:Metallo-dependent phosphatase [Leucogyrophana mollusca]
MPSCAMLALLFSLGLFGLALAHAGDDAHDHADLHAREYPQFPLTPPYRPLVWSDFNVIHTTDTHGWLLGHQKASFPEPDYSGDLGDFSSFVAHMKQIAIEKDVDLLLVDSGDLHDGTGLSDGFPPGGVDAHESNKFLERLPYDVMSIGNHELYIYANTYDMYTNFVPHLNGRYLSSNVNITVFGADGEAESVPVGGEWLSLFS